MLLACLKCVFPSDLRGLFRRGVRVWLCDERALPVADQPDFLGRTGDGGSVLHLPAHRAGTRLADRACGAAGAWRDRRTFVRSLQRGFSGQSVCCGLGGIFVEVLKDISSGLAPLSYEEAYSMIHSLRAYKIIKGTRGQKGVNEDKFAEIIVRLSTLLRFATEIKEMDINPLLATEKQVIAVDARIRIEK